MAGKKKLAAVVYVDGVAHGPGDVPASVAKQITNPKAWASEDAPAAEPDDSGSAGDDGDSGDDA